MNCPLGRCVLFGLAPSLAIGSTRADVVAVVSSTSAVTTPSKDQVTDIFLGKVGRFPIGAQAIPIDQADGSPARDEFYATYAGKSPAPVRSHWATIIFTGRGQPPKAVPTNVEVRQMIAANPQAIGYIERSAVDSTVKVVL